MKVSGDGWSQDADGYWYYDTPVQVGDSTLPLNIELEGLPTNVDPEYLLTQIAVGVVYESTTAYYEEDGVNFQPAEWGKVLDSGESSPSTP